MPKLTSMLVVLAAMGLSAQSQATIVNFTQTNIGDNVWQYDYSLFNDSGSLEIEEFTIFYDWTLYTALTVIASPDGWDTIVIQPDLGIPDSGFVDSLALGPGLLPGATLTGLSVRFEWLGGGAPGVQPFSVIDPETFEPVDGGTTQPPVDVPTPGALSLMLAGIMGLLLFGRRRRGARLARPIAAPLLCLIPLAAQAQINLDLVSSTRVSRTTFDYTYRLRIPNDGAGVSSAPMMFRIASTPAGVTVIDGMATIAWMYQTGDHVSMDTVTLRQDRTIPFSPASIGWESFVLGRFRSPSVGGLSYSYGSTNGALTDSLGQYAVPPGVPVTFRVGAVNLGTTGPIFQDNLWPMDLVSGGTAITPQVLNITRFLHMLDVDGNPDNGILISPAVRAAAATWPQPDFTTTNLPAAIASIVASAQAADGGAHAIPTEATVLNRLRSAYYCMRSGIYTGSYTQTWPVDAIDRGAVVAQPNSFGVGYYLYFPSDPGRQVTFMTGGSPGYDTALTGSFNAVLDFGIGAFRNNGFFYSYAAVFTSWEAPVAPPAFRLGTMNASRPLPPPLPNWYRFTGATNDQTSAVLELQLQSLLNGATVLGFLYEPTTGTLRPLSGTLTGNTLTASASGGVPINGTLTAGPGAPRIEGSMVMGGAPLNFYSEGCRD